MWPYPSNFAGRVPINPWMDTNAGQVEPRNGSPEQWDRLRRDRLDLGHSGARPSAPSPGLPRTGLRRQRGPFSSRTGPSTAALAFRYPTPPLRPTRTAAYYELLPEWDVRPAPDAPRSRGEGDFAYCRGGAHPRRVRLPHPSPPRTLRRHRRSSAAQSLVFRCGSSTRVFYHLDTGPWPSSTPTDHTY